MPFLSLLLPLLIILEASSAVFSPIAANIDVLAAVDAVVDVVIAVDFVNVFSVAAVVEAIEADSVAAVIDVDFDHRCCHRRCRAWHPSGLRCSSLQTRPFLAPRLFRPNPRPRHGERP